VENVVLEIPSAVLHRKQDKLEKVKGLKRHNVPDHSSTQPHSALEQEHDWSVAAAHRKLKKATNKSPRLSKQLAAKRSTDPENGRLDIRAKKESQHPMTDCSKLSSTKKKPRCPSNQYQATV